MKNSLLKLLILSLFTICSFNAFAQKNKVSLLKSKKISEKLTKSTVLPTDIAKIISNFEKDEKYKDKNLLKEISAINVATFVSYDVKKDYSYTKSIKFVKKILNYKGKKRYSDLKLYYNPDYEEIKLGNSYSINLQKKCIYIPENQVYDLNTNDAVTSPYINQRQKIMNFPQIEPGYYIVVEYKIVNKRKEAFGDVVHLKESNPYALKTVKIRYPKYLKIKYNNVSNIKVKFSKKMVKNNILLSWEIKNSDYIKDENNTPSYLIAGSPIVFTFNKSWKTLGKAKLGKLNSLKITAQVKEIAKKVTKGKKNDNDKLLAIYNYMAKNFNVKESYTSQIDFSPMSFDKIINHKYGSTRDLTAFFIALAKSVNIKNVFPALILNGNEKYSQFQKDYPQIGFASEICAFYKGDLIYPGNNYYPYKYAGITDANIVLGNKNFGFVNYTYKTRFLTKSKYSYKLNGINSELTVHSVFKGPNNFQYRSWLLELPKDKQKIWFNQSLGQKSAQLINGPKFDNSDKLSKNLKLDYSLKYSDFVVNQKPYKYFSIGNIKSFELPNVSLVKRENAYEVTARVLIDQTYEVKLDRKAKFINSIPKGKTLVFESNNVKSIFKIKSELKNGVVYVYKNINIPKQIIAKKDYPKFREFVLAMKNKLNDMVFLEN